MSPKPTAQGTLGKTPFAHLLLYAHDRRLTGTLAIWPEQNASGGRGQDRLFLQEGAVVAVRCLGAFPSAFEAVVSLFSRSDGPYGFYADQNLLGSSEDIVRGTVDVYAALSRGILQHAREPVVETLLARVGQRPLRVRSGLPIERFKLSTTQRAFVERLQKHRASLADLTREGLVPSAEARRLIYLLALVRGLETAEDDNALTGFTMDSLRPGPVSRSPSEPAEAQSEPVPLSSMRPPLATPRSSPTSPTNTSSPTPQPAAPSAPLISGVASATGSARISNHASGSFAAGTASNTGITQLPAPPAPAGLTHQDAARWNELATLYDRLDELTHYQLLGVPQSANTNDINTAYFALVKKFHPDRLSSQLTPLARCAQQLFDRLTEANHTLSNPETRPDYDRSVADGGGTRAAERMMRNVLDSALEFQKAEVLLKRRDFAQAMQHVRSALNKNPDEPDYHALYGWLLHLMNPSEPAPLDEMLKSLDKAIKANPNSERTHYYRGVVLKRLKRDQEALSHFRAAAQINPRNVDAVREVRLASMRRESKPPPAGLFSKLFKGPKE